MHAEGARAKGFCPSRRPGWARALVFGLGLCLPPPLLALPAGIGALSWQDEFDGSSLDLAKWGHRYPGARFDAINTPEAVSVAGGALAISTYTRDGVHYTGMIGTQGLFQQTYGYFEARIRFNDSPGAWSAFWLQSPTYGNPIGDVASAGAELDVIEHRAADALNGDATGLISSAIHWDGYGTSHRSTGLLMTPPGPTSPQANWHTYGLLWTPGDYQVFFDDQWVWTASAPVSQRSEYLILSTEVRDASWAGLIPGSGYGDMDSTTTVMEVDYVRAYAYSLPEPPPWSLFALFAPLPLLLRRDAQARRGAPDPVDTAHAPKPPDSPSA